MKHTIEQLIPHREPMILIDAIESVDMEKGSLTARFDVSPKQIFFDEAAGGVPGWAAIEYMAQTAAALAGEYDLQTRPGQAPKPGLLLGARRVPTAFGVFRDGCSYFVTATQAFHDEEAAAFECVIRDAEGNELSTAVLNAYRPPDFAGFLRTN